jgi:tetratricopeptide (TPR) repeat protein
MSSKADRSKLALVIGIDVYRSEGLDNLSSCKKDAEDVCKLLQEELGYTIFQNEPIIGSRLNKENSWVDIHKAILSFFKSAKPGQTLLFYFSGHGIPREDEIYLAMPEVNTQDPMVEGFSLTRLTQLMKSSKSMQIVSIIDACYSGAAVLPTIRTKAMVAKETAGRALAAYDRILDNIPKAEGRCFLLSSQAYEPSLAAEDNYSLYTKYFIEGLRGAKAGIDEKGLRYPASVDDDGNVTPETLHKYLYHKVANEAEQVPKIKSDMASNIILAHHTHLAKNKPNIDSIVKEGDEHFLKDEYDKAIECYDRAIEVDPYLVDAWHKKGNALYNKENYDEAIECYDRASLINPNHFDSWYKKGLTYKKKNNHDQAIKCYDRAIQIRATSSSAWYEKGISLSYFKRHEDAIKCYDNAIELNPKHAEAWYRKGYAFYEMQQDDEALRCYNRAKEIDPDLRNEWYGGGGEPPVLIPPPSLQPLSEPEHAPPFSRSPLQQPPPRKSNLRIITIVIIAVSAAAVAGLLIAFAGGYIFPPDNDPPIAAAGTDKVVYTAGSTVMLDGSSSRDPDNNDVITSYKWQQIAGSPVIELNDPNAPTSSFIAPDVTSDTTFTFELTVTDGKGQSAEDSVQVTVEPKPPTPTPPESKSQPASQFPPNNAPIAVAGMDRTVNAGSLVSLDGSSSRDPDNNDKITSYKWQQTSGTPQIKLTNSGSVNPIFIAPDVTSDTTFTFELTVTDGKGQSAEDSVQVIVQPPVPPAPSASKSQTPSQSSADLIYKGNDLFNSGRYEEAIEYYDQVPSTDTNYYIALTNKGNTLNSLERYSEAITYYDKALAIEPNYKEALSGKGSALYGLGRYSEAITYIDKALAIDPNYKPALTNKGNTLERLGRYSEAITYYDKALAIDPNYKEALSGKGNALYGLGRYSEAITYYDKALAIDPNYKEALSGKGSALYGLGRYSEAITYYDKALAIDPNFAVASNNKQLALGMLERQANDDDSLTQPFEDLFGGSN